MKKYLKHNLLGIFSLILSAISFTVYAVFALFINWIVAFIIIISSFVNITLKNVSFSYGDEAALNNVSLKFQKGKKYAIVGKS